MVDQLGRRLAFRISNSFENARLGDPAEIVVDGWSPPGLDHVEPDGARQDIGLLCPSVADMARALKSGSSIFMTASTCTIWDPSLSPDLRLVSIFPANSA
jgi:hypothetical protein